MKDIERHCDTCRFSYLELERGQDRIYLRQRCSSPDYNALKNVHDSMMEDWGRNFCRFWTPKTQKG